MRVIQELQGNRPVSVRLFDELARQLTNNVFFERLTLRGGNIDVFGALPKTIAGSRSSFEPSTVPYGLRVAMLPSINAFSPGGP